MRRDASRARAKILTTIIAPEGHGNAYRPSGNRFSTGPPHAIGIDLMPRHRLFRGRHSQPIDSSNAHHRPVGVLLHPPAPMYVEDSELVDAHELFHCGGR